MTSWEDNYVVLRFNKVHRFIDMSPRIMDLRGRNAFLVLLRKLVAELIANFVESIAEGHSCGDLTARILRCGGNAIYVSFPAMGYEEVEKLRYFMQSLLDFLGILCTPMSAEAELMENGRRLLLHRSFPENHVMSISRLRIGSEKVVSNVLCGVCGDLGLGVDLSTASDFVRHVIRDERSCCVRDLIFRLLGRVFTNPGVVTFFRSSRGGYKLQPWSYRDILLRDEGIEDVVTSELASLSKLFRLTFRIRFFRHSRYCGDRFIADLLLRSSYVDGELVVRAVGLGMSDEGRCRGAINRAVTGLRRLYHEYFRRLNDLIETGNVRDFQAYAGSTLPNLLRALLLNLLRTQLEALHEGLADPNSAPHDRLFAEQLNLDEFIRRLDSETCLSVFPILREGGKTVFLDPELSYINLDGSSAYDLDSIASKGESIAFIRCDGDRFGVATDPFKILEYPDLWSGLPKLSEALKALVTGLPNRIVAEGLARVRWDHLVEYMLCKYVRMFTPILFRNDGLSPLIIYVGGDENLLIAPVSRGNLHALFESLKSFRNLLLLTTAMAMRQAIRSTGVEVGSEDFLKIVSSLKRCKVSTLSGALILTKAKIPAYYIALHANEGVELAKEAGRDSLTIYTLVSLNIEDPSNYRRWLASLAAPLPFECRGVDCLSELLKAYNYVYNNPELSEYMYEVWDYCIRKALSVEKCLDTIDRLMKPILLHSSSSTGSLVNCLRSTCPQRYAYAAIELIRYLERGV